MIEKNIEYVNQHMYLGIILDEKLSFKQQLVEVANKATSIFHKIRRGAKASWRLDFKALEILYKGIGESIILYGAAVWTPQNDPYHLCQHPVKGATSHVVNGMQGIQNTGEGVSPSPCRNLAN